jgi:hypothetical protein
MKLDDASKVAALTSTLVAMIVSVAAYLGNRQVQSLDAKIQQINIAAKSFDEAKAQYVATAKLGVEYGAPLARSFALRVLDRTGSDVQRDFKIMIPTNSLSD